MNDKDTFISCFFVGLGLANIISSEMIIFKARLSLSYTARKIFRYSFLFLRSGTAFTSTFNSASISYCKPGNTFEILKLKDFLGSEILEWINI